MAAVAYPGRPQIRRNSPLSISNGMHGFLADAPMLQRIDLNDSDSEDEPPPAIKFSKVTQALLNEAPVPTSLPKQEPRVELSRPTRALNTSRAGLDTPSRAPAIKIIRKSSPAASSDLTRGKTPPRVVQIGAKGSGSASKRSISIAGPYPYRFPAARTEPTSTEAPSAELITPAPAPRALRVRTRANSAASQNGDGPSSSRPGSRNGARSAAGSEHGYPASELARSTTVTTEAELQARLATSNTGVIKTAIGEAAAPPGSIRVKRPALGGSLLGAPRRRGFRRRESEENISPADEIQDGSISASQSASRSASNYTPQSGSGSGRATSRTRPEGVVSRATSVEPISAHDFANQGNASQDSRPASRQAQRYLPQAQTAQEADAYPRPTTGFAQPRQHDVADGNDLQRISEQLQAAKPAVEQKALQRAPSLKSAQYRYVAPAQKIHTDAADDQENMPPPTFRRNKDQECKHLGKPTMSILSDDAKPSSRQVEETSVPVPQEQRRVLGAISGNTPHRTGNTPHRTAPAPPPKMSVIDAATTKAGASTTKSKKKRSHTVVNGKIYTQMAELGRGGSSRVHCVMAENYMTFALKKVKLQDQDESAVRGYKGEIDLLKKLTEVERVVRLYDWELNDEKQELSVLMEKGETDLEKLLRPRLQGHNVFFDPVFTRYYWREMLECVQAVHEEDVVHSDLKPANFLVVSGRLKLIDFGIANAIDTDNTVNVHRDTHVGTPNYMSPESITDTNAPQPGSVSSRDAAGNPPKKDMRIGKASDVWSLGCILYQMTYGRAPFAHIPNQLTRIMAITNPNHAISFPETGIGGVAIPPNLRGSLRRCLNRDPDKRPSVLDLLSQSDAFMYPERSGTVILDEGFLSQIIGKVVERCRERGIPGDAEVKGYARSFMERVWEMQAQDRG